MPQRLAAIAVLAIAMLIALASLSKSEYRLTWTNGIHAGAWAVENLSSGDGPVCIDGQYVPSETGRIQVFVGTYDRPSAKLTATILDSDGVPATQGSISGKGIRETVSIPLRPIARDLSGASLCLTVDSGKFALAGTPQDSQGASALTVDGEPRSADVHVEYLTGKKSSLFSHVPEIFERASLFKAGWVGPWTFFAITIAGVALIGLLVAALFRLGIGSEVNVRRWAAAVALFAAANALLWTVVSPAFQPPDEAAQYSYTESLVVRGERPLRTFTGGYGSYTERTNLAQQITAAGIVLNPNARPPWTEAAVADWRKRDAALPDRGKLDGGGWTSSAGYSPLYYAPAAVPYKLSSDNTFTRLWLMRLWSVLLCALSAVFCFLFARELSPRSTWFAPIAGLAVAFEPMFAHIGGAFQNDNLLIALASATLWLVAKGLRRGVDLPLAAAVGGVFALGYVAKPTMIGLAPAVGLGLAVAIARSDACFSRRTAQIAVAGAAAISIAALAQILWGQGTATASNLEAGETAPFNLTGLISYTWQWYLPALPGMTEFAVGTPPAFSIYLKGSFAAFNHLDTYLADAWYLLFGIVVAVLALAAATWGWRRRDAAAEWWPAAAVCVTAVAGLALLVNLRSYLALLETGGPFAQGRYLLPGIAVFGAMVAAGSGGFGRKYGLAVATFVVLFLAVANLFGMAVSLQRFYL